jgi:hypothetical protein
MDDFPMVRVVWCDAVDCTDWVELTDVDHKCATITSLGYLINNDDRGITLAMNLDPDDEKVSMTLVIPNHWIISLDALT